MSDKIYVGNGKRLEFKSGGSALKFSFSAKDITTLSDNMNSAGWVNIVIAERREPGARGQTHYAYIDTWQPSGDRAAARPTEQRPAQQEEKSAAEEAAELPF